MDNKLSKSSASLKISNDVLTRIAEIAATEIRGVASEGERLVVCDKGVTQLTNKIISPVKAVVKNEAAEISVNIVVLQGFKASNVAAAVQNCVKSAVQSMAGVPVSKVNVKITDIKLNTANQ